MKAISLLLLCGCLAGAQDPHPAPVGEDELAALLARHPEAFGRILRDARSHRVQILVSNVIESPGGPRLQRHGFRLGAEYFYPASAIKLCAAVAALQWLEQRAGRGETPRLQATTPLRFHPLFPDEKLEDRDPSNRDGGTITIAHEIRKLFLASDNRAFNRLFELVGPDRVHTFMHAAGLRSVRCLHRLAESRSWQANHRLPRVDFLLPKNRLHTLPARRVPGDLDSRHVPGILVGERFARTKQCVFEGPTTFALKNSISLLDLQDALIKLVRPDIDLGTPGFGLDAAHRRLCLDAMTRFPRTSPNPAYGAELHPDAGLKFVMPGVARVIPAEQVEVTNKVGGAYGFMIENARVRDRRSGRSFFLSAVIYANPNGTLNDGVYAYEELADPFFADLGEAVARWLWP